MLSSSWKGVVMGEKTPCMLRLQEVLLARVEHASLLSLNSKAIFLALLANADI